MKVLVACEESQAVCKAFREREATKHTHVTLSNVQVVIQSGILCKMLFLC